jgi:Cation transporter/ATPase, N-terminus
MIHDLQALTPLWKYRYRETRQCAYKGWRKLAGPLMPETAFWKQPASVALAEPAVTDGGLTSDQAARRLLISDTNDAAALKRAPAWLRFVQRLANPLVMATAVSAAIGIDALRARRWSRSAHG